LIESNVWVNNLTWILYVVVVRLMKQIDRAITDMLENNELPALARAAGVTYLPPRQPNVSCDVTITDLRRN
jgi:hypothetical protein